MTKFETYRSPDAPVPERTLAWNMYGPGLENIGRDGKPEAFAVPQPNDDQLLVRIDAVSLCFSDVKLIQQGGKHPKLYNRDLQTEPTRLGHETTLTVMAVGKDLRDHYHVGQRLAIQPDIYQNGVATAYGYTIPGGLIQYHLIGSEVLHADAGAYVLPVGDDLGYAEAALTEPWACVEGAYRQRRRLTPKTGGTMWIVGRSDDPTVYEFSQGLDAPASIILTDAPISVRELAQNTHATVIERNDLHAADYAALNAELANGHGFDDIVLLDPRSAADVTEAAKLIAFRGTLNLIGRAPLDGLPQIDVGRIHYHYTAYLGNPGPDIAASYGEAHNRSDLKPDGVTVFVGAGGPMGQMHIQRAIEMPHGPRVLLASDVNDERLEVLQQQFGSMAEERDKHLITINPNAGQDLHAAVQRVTDGAGADDVIVSVPVPAIMADAATLLAPDGMLVLFAGVPNGSFAPLNLSNVYLHNAQFTGTSGSSLDDQATVIRKTAAHELSPNRSVAAIGGIEAARDGIQAMMEGRFPGKIVIFPQISRLPLTGLHELHTALPDVAAALDPGDVWTPQAERVLIETFWQP